MRIQSILVRFYRAFNYDYLRKNSANAVADPWDQYEGRFYPYVRVDIDPDVTCVVGANESGKSQLLDAAELALGYGTPSPTDFCRYSAFFSVDASSRVPQFGLVLTDLDATDRSGLENLSVLGIDADLGSFVVVRDSADSSVVYIQGQEPQTVDVQEMADFLPHAFRIDPARALPDSVPIDYLINAGDSDASSVSRSERWSLIDPILKNFEQLRIAIDEPSKLSEVFSTIDQPASKSSQQVKLEREESELAYQLLVTIAGVDGATFKRLHNAVRAGNDGYANALVAKINGQLAKGLNLRRWWTQDRDFELQVASRDFDLVFTIKDRTASEYSFRERSSGLKYFLSYLVQYLAHAASSDCANLLLMDEPDTYLSNQGQQDLLHLFQDFADRDAGGATKQVIFVTHSPFLIDKNHAERVRVLDKGRKDEGTRVVRDVARNHFEPLRSAFGGFVGETAFIGNCNLLLEGVSDQIYLAGASSVLLAHGASHTERLDLNTVTLVACGSASHVPYMAYLARGRDVQQPAVVALLDGDKEGRLAVKTLARGGPRLKQVLAPEHILQVEPEQFPGVQSDRPEGPCDIEDLVPLELLLQAAAAFADEIGMDDVRVTDVSTVKPHLSAKIGSLGAVQAAYKDQGTDLHLDKIGIARHVVALLKERPNDFGADRALTNFRQLFVVLTERMRSASAQRSEREVGMRVERMVAAFLSDFRTGATKADLKIFLERLDGVLDSTPASEELRKQIRIMTSERKLDVDLSDPLPDHEGLAGEFDRLRYAPLLSAQEQPDEEE